MKTITHQLSEKNFIFNRNQSRAITAQSHEALGAGVEFLKYILKIKNND